jgi:phospholipid transport system substrate-binding protein
MARAIRKALILYGISALVLSSVSFAQAGATAQVKGTIDKVLEILRDPALKAPDKAEARRKKLKEAIYPWFDFTEMAKRSLGIHWGKRTPQEREEFVTLFADLLEHSYATRLETYTDQEILYTKEQVEDKFGLVVTKIVSTKENIDIPIEYKLLRQDNEWKVYDVVVDGISMVSNYRSQFNRIIETSSYAELVQRMRVKQESEALSTVPAPKKKK